jgi:hypothetical protein
MFLAVINFTASIFGAALPAMMLSRVGAGEIALGAVNTATGIATLAGSILVSVMPPPKSRVRVICNCLLFSMSTENFILAFGRSTPVWCFGAILGWIFILLWVPIWMCFFVPKFLLICKDVSILQGITLQFFTIPLGYLCGGFLVDNVFEPFMAMQSADSLFIAVFGAGKGSGAALLFFVIGVFGALSCLPFRADKNIWKLEE